MSLHSLETCAVLLALVCVGSTQELYLETFPTGVWKIPEDTLHNLTVSLRFNSSQDFESDSTLNSKMVIRVAANEDWKLDFVNPIVEFTVEEITQEVNKTITFSGYYWGLSKLTFYLIRDDLNPDFENGTVLGDGLMIIVDRKLLVLDYVFIGCGLVFMLCNNTMMGSQLDLKIIFSVLKRPLGPICGFISQFTLMPLLTYGFGKAFFDDPLDRLGLFTLGCCPGGASSNFWTLMFDGDINLSITMTALSTIAAMGMMPLWMFTLGQSLLQDNDNLQIPFANLTFSLIGLTIPVGLGILMKYKRPHWATKAKKIIKPFTLIVILFFMIMGTYNSYKVFLLMTGEMVAAGCLVSIGGYILGGVFGKLFCLSRPQIIAISIETAMQNPGVAFILLKLSLPSPNSDLASLPIMAAMMLTGPPVMILYFICIISKRYCGCCLGETIEKADEVDAIGAKEVNSFLSDVEVEAALKNKEDLPANCLPLYDGEKGKSIEELEEFGKTHNIIVLEGFTKNSLKKKISC